MLLFKEGSLLVTLKNIRLTDSPLWSHGDPPQSFLRQLVRFVFAVYNQEPVLLIVPTCYKSLLINTWATITIQNKLVKVYLTPDTETSQLIGQMQPYLTWMYYLS